jgi:tagatose 6-phosphate kinase
MAHPRFLTITPNPAVDTTYLIDRLTLGAINRVDQALPVAGGKGNNVARILAALGQTPTATGFTGGHTGTFIERGLKSAGVVPSFVSVPGASRVCLTIVEQETGRITEVREPGQPVTAEDAERLLGHVRNLARETDVAVISGSLPPGLPSDFVTELVSLLKSHNVFVALDTSGEALRGGLRGQPDLIKPNRDEIRDLIGPFADRDELVVRVQERLFGELLSPTAAVLVSLGADGALLIEPNRAIVAKPPSVDSVNSVGSGDALLAGFLDARGQGCDLPQVLARAVATGTAAALDEAVGVVNGDDIERIYAEVIVETIPAIPTMFVRQVCQPQPAQRCHAR